MLSIFLEGFAQTGFTLVVLAIGMLFALWPRITRPGRLALILFGLSFALIISGFVLRQYLVGLIWENCRQDGARLAVNLQIWSILLAGALAAFAVGMWAGALWRGRRKLVALALTVAAAPLIVIVVYVLFIGSGMSAEGCFS